MPLTSAQQLVIKNNILADPVLSLLPQSSGAVYDIIKAFLLPAIPDFMVWNKRTPVENIYDAITWANYTPADVPDTTSIWTNRALACQGKQFNIQTMLLGREFINAEKPNIRNGLQDALQSIPSGAGNANLAGGWPAVKIALTRQATRLEQLFASGVGSPAAPGLTVITGSLGYDEVLTIMGW